MVHMNSAGPGNLHINCNKCRDPSVQIGLMGFPPQRAKVQKHHNWVIMTVGAFGWIACNPSPSQLSKSNPNYRTSPYCHDLEGWNDPFLHRFSLNLVFFLLFFHNWTHWLGRVNSTHKNHVQMSKQACRKNYGQTHPSHLTQCFPTHSGASFLLLIITIY